ncbi:MAG: thioredoxin [Alphaproteobacteria bacterium]|nr:MAG: thioredoxin [Alphaproteobacteria bacterium]
MATAALAAEVPMGEDGLHKPDWLHTTFKDMREDLAEANAEGKRLVVIWEQRGCIYCAKMHEEVFVDPEIERLLRERFFVVQMNLFGDEDVTDFDGTTLPEKEMARRWGIVFTPTMMFFPEEVPEGLNAAEAAVVTMPGAFGKKTTRNLLTWILEKGYETGEHFQKYHARKLREEAGN